MEKKNMVLLTVIAVATLLVAVVGATFAYFTATITDSRGEGEDNGQAAIQAAETPGSLIIEQSKSGFSSFNEQNVYPGHKELIQLKIKSISTNTTDTYFNIVYEGENTFPNNTIKFTIYESKSDLDEGITADNAFTCSKESEKLQDASGQYKLYEKCTLNPTLTAKTMHPLQTVSPVNYNESNGQTSKKTVLNGEHPFVITGNEEEKTLFFYVVVEYFNQEGNQTSSDEGKSLNGKISVEIAPRDSGAYSDTEGNLTTKEGA